MTYSENDAINLVNDFFSKMHQWGERVIFLYKNENGGPQKNQEAMRNDLRIIYDRFLTKKDRKTGRLEAMAVSLGHPDYDPKNEKIKKSEKIASGFFVYSDKSYDDDDGYSESYRYKVVKTGDGLRLDYRERYSDYNNKWVKDIL